MSVAGAYSQKISVNKMTAQHHTTKTTQINRAKPMHTPKNPHNTPVPTPCHPTPPSKPPRLTPGPKIRYP